MPDGTGPTGGTGAADLTLVAIGLAATAAVLLVVALVVLRRRTPVSPPRG
jgi:hypothetical protein